MLKMKVKLILSCDMYMCTKEKEIDGLMSIVDNSLDYKEPIGWFHSEEETYCPYHLTGCLTNKD